MAAHESLGEQFKDANANGGREHWNPGDKAYFEYHCLESHNSSDAHLWYRSHQPVTVYHENSGESDLPSTYADRQDAGMFKFYHVEFPDKSTGTAHEDELLTHPKHYYRPDPPKGPLKGRPNG